MTSTLHPAANERNKFVSATIYHNPNCGTSRNTLALIRNAGIEPEVIEYVTSPPRDDDVSRFVLTV